MASGKKPEKKAEPKQAAPAKTEAAEGGDFVNNTEKDVMNALLDAISGKKTFGEILGISADQAYNMAQMGYRLLQEGQLEQARTMFQGLVTLNPKDPYMHLALGSVFHRMEKVDPAIGEYTKAIDLDREMTNAYANRGELHLTKGDADKGLADLKKALELDPNGEDPSTLRARAILAAAAGKLKEKGVSAPAKAGAGAGGKKK